MVVNTSRILNKQEAIHRIGEIAALLYKKLNLSPGFNIDYVITSLGGTIHTTPASIHSVNTIEAKIEKSSHSDLLFEITMSEDEILPRKRFTLAHELGHFILHMLTSKDGQVQVDNVTYKQGGYGFKEWEANEFALAFLMPQKAFREAALATSDHGFYNLDALASQFQVSTDIINMRGAMLGLWKH